MLKRRVSFDRNAARKRGCAAQRFLVVSNFHGASGLDVVFVVIAVATDAAHLVALV